MPSPVGFDAAALQEAKKSQQGSLQHAWLELYEPSKDGALDKPGPSMGKVAFQFNPKELSLAKTATWSRPTTQASKRASPPQYQGPQPSKLSLEIFLDGAGKPAGSVVQTVEKLFLCCVPTEASHGQKKASPPWVQFRWGGLVGFLAYMESVQAKYTLFTADGLPIRAVCTVSLAELAGEPPATNPTSGGRVPHREHVVVAGESLAGIAYQEYGKATLWRAVADVNRIDDPSRLPPGRKLLLPTVDELLRSQPVDQRGPAVPAPPAPQARREVVAGAAG